MFNPQLALCLVQSHPERVDGSDLTSASVDLPSHVKSGPSGLKTLCGSGGHEMQKYTVRICAL
jgi:hypothetical protein